MLAACPDLQLFTHPTQTPPGATALAVPSGPGAHEAIARLIEENRIDAFWPQGSALGGLDALPCEHHGSATPPILRLLDDKQAFHHWLADDAHRPVQVAAHGVDAAVDARRSLADAGIETCVKPNVGVNGSGYWRFTADGHSFLDDPEPREIHPDVWTMAARMAEAVRGPTDHLVMEWLPGPEASVDVLCWRGRPLIHAVRVKTGPNEQRIMSEHPVVRHARDLCSRLWLHGPVSVQYRLDARGSWRILEINPRPAGGSIHSEDMGFRIIGDWARLVARRIGADDVVQEHGDVLVRMERTAVRDEGGGENGI